MEKQHLGLYKQLADGSAVLICVIDESVCAGEVGEFRSSVSSAAFHAIVNLPDSEGCVGVVSEGGDFPVCLSSEYMRESLRIAIVTLSRK